MYDKVELARDHLGRTLLLDAPPLLRLLPLLLNDKYDRGEYDPPV